MSVVYFIQAGPDGLVKIGVTTNFAERLADLQAGSPLPLRVLQVMPGGRDLERDLHTRFKSFRTHGEWFLPEPELLVAARRAPADIVAEDDEEERLLTPEEVASILRVSVRYVWRLGRAGKLERVKRGKYVRFPEAAVRRYVEDGRGGPLRAGAAVLSPLELPTGRLLRRPPRFRSGGRSVDVGASEGE